MYAARKALSAMLGRGQRSPFYNTPQAYLKLPPVKAFISHRLLCDPNRLSQAYSVAQSPPAIDVHILEFPASSGMGECWSCWGQGLLASNRRLYFAVGNHLESGADGNSHLYCYDTVSGSLDLAVDVRKIVPDSGVAAGKIHGTIGEANDGKIYFLTYWGVEKEERARAGFKGSALLSFDPGSNEAACLGIPSEGQVFRAAVMDSGPMLFYLVGLPSRAFLCYGLHSRSLLYRSPAGLRVDDRHLFSVAPGEVLFSFDGGELGLYRHEERGVCKLGKSLKPKSTLSFSNLLHPKPAPFLRCMAAAPGSRTGYGINGSGRLFSLELDSYEVRLLRSSFAADEYVASLAIGRDGKFLYYVPGSLGSAAALGTPVVQYNTATGQLKVLAFLAPYFREAFHYRIGGCYSLSLDEDGKRLFMVFNGTPVRNDVPFDRQPPFGQPCLVVLNIPDGERG
jgi:hypothetical protein